MKTSETIEKIAPALVLAQNNIKYAVENSVNPHLKNRYADLSSVIDAVKPALNHVQIVFVQMPEESEPGVVRLTTRLIHASGEWIETTSSCPMPKNDPQGYGSALTYLRRYSLSAFAAISQEDDDANAASRPAKQAAVDESQLLDYVAAIESAPSSEELQRLYKEAYDLCKGNQTWQTRIIEAKKVRVERAKKEKQS